MLDNPESCIGGEMMACAKKLLLNYEECPRYVCETQGQSIEKPALPSIPEVTPTSLDPDGRVMLSGLEVSSTQVSSTINNFNLSSTSSSSVTSSPALMTSLSAFFNQSVNVIIYF